MYCEGCGKPLNPAANFCSACGKSVVDAVVPPAQGRVARHLPIVAVLWLIASVLRLLGGLAALFVGSVFLPRFFAFAGWPFHDLIPGVVMAVAICLIVAALAGLAAGWALLQREQWARGLILILAVIALLNFPLGTALGIYTLWVFLPVEAEREYRRMTGLA